MATAYWSETRDQRQNFTSKLLKYWWQSHGGAITDRPTDADVVLASICSPREVSVVERARAVADTARAPLLVGGPEAYTGSTYLAWADYLCVGEGYELLSRLAPTQDVRGILDSESNVLSRSDPEREVVPSYSIPWSKLPPVRTAEHAWYLLAGRGCHRKCKFCYTSWTQPHRRISDTLLRRQMDRLKHRDVVLVTNDEGHGGTLAGSMTLRQYLEVGESMPFMNVVRLGIEGVTEQRRRWFGKPISDADLAQAIAIARGRKMQLQLFWIVGFADDPDPRHVHDPLLSLIDAEECRAPRIYLKYTWFEPGPHTPLARWDLAGLSEWDYREAASALQARSGRFRVFRAGSIGLAVWSATMRRCTHTQAREWAGYESRMKALDADHARALAVAVLGPAVVDGTGSYPWERVHCSIRSTDG